VKQALLSLIHMVIGRFLEFRVIGIRMDYRGNSLIRNIAPIGPYSRTMPRALWWS
jgi:hypothetical protein